MTPQLGKASWVHHVCPTTELVFHYNYILLVVNYDLHTIRTFLLSALSGLLLCMDGIPAFSFAKEVSLKPLDFKNLSLPPAQREKIDYILLMMLVPDTLKGRALKKYFDFAAKFELNDLFHNGIDGIKVKVFSTSMDTPGRAELLGNAFVLYVNYHSSLAHDQPYVAISVLFVNYLHAKYTLSTP